MNLKYVSQSQIDCYFFNIKEALKERYHSSSSNNVKNRCKDLILQGTKTKNFLNYVSIRNNDSFYSQKNFLGKNSLKDLLAKCQNNYYNSFQKILSLEDYSNLYLASKKDEKDFKKVLKSVINKKVLIADNSLKFLDTALADLSAKDFERVSKVENKYRLIENNVSSKGKKIIIEYFLDFYSRLNDKLPLNDSQYLTLVEIDNLMSNSGNESGGNNYSELEKMAESLPHAPKIKERVGQRIALKNEGSDKII